MPILSIALFGMRRRFLSTLFTLFSTTAILLTGTVLGYWSYWIHGDQANLKAHRSAAIFVSPERSHDTNRYVAEVMDMTGVESASVVKAEEFMNYLEDYFPDLKVSIDEIGTEILPTMIQVSFDKALGLVARANIIKSIEAIQGTIRVDDGAKQAAGAIVSLNWLSMGAGVMGACLWFVLIIVSFTHFQAVQFKELQEIKLLRGFGASESWILLPWIVEACVYAIFATIIGVAALWFGRGQLALLFNQFFETLGYEKFLIGTEAILWAGAVMFLAALVAHILGGLVALLRGKFA